ncbi:MAG TPA: fumarylacetoacetate hydrolase family protein [Propionibacterium sp.]|jgi:2-keto-4-pentenoate hydratase/2-oxohepta-3-ene-1,7-dioic acid hydratase in catechol pathway|nr:fumarylacetoacetate hydrolase family protein [Propionibacterium sp.]
MRVARFSTGGDPVFGLVELAADGGEHPDTVAVISGDPLASAVQFTGERHALADVRLLAPVIPRSKVIAVGPNYVDLARDLGQELTDTPITFFKPNTAVIGPDEAIIYPDFSNEVGFEGELAVVIGRICKEVPPERVQDVIFGYTIGNDVSARDIQFNEAQWSRAKGFDTSCPLGPWITCHLSVEEAQNLRITTTLDGALHQNASTSDMVHSIRDLVSFISSYMTLLPGDVLLTGTPGGVGLMEPGQTVSVSIEQLGTLANPVVGSRNNPAGAQQ